METELVRETAQRPNSRPSPVVELRYSNSTYLYQVVHERPHTSATKNSSNPLAATMWLRHLHYDTDEGGLTKSKNVVQTQTAPDRMKKPSLDLSQIPHLSDYSAQMEDLNQKPANELPTLDPIDAKLCKVKPYSKDLYAAFKRANVVKGILCPSLTNSFKQRSLEHSYLTYTHRQRQKSLIFVNIVDILLKVIIAILYMSLRELNKQGNMLQSKIWSIGCVLVNIFICILGCWRCFANNYLHYASVFTWLLFNVQGFISNCIGVSGSANLVWYILFIIFVPYAMLPLPLKSCVIAGALTAICHLAVIAIIEMQKREGQHCVSFRVSTYFILYTAINLAGMYTKYLTDRSQRLAFIETHKAMEHKQESERELLRTQKLLDSS